MYSTKLSTLFSTKFKFSLLINASRHSSFFVADRRAVTESCNSEILGHRLHTVLAQFEARRVHLSSAPYDQLISPQINYVLRGRCSTDRPLTPCTNVRRRWYVQTRSGMALYFTVQLLATEIGRLRIFSARHEEAATLGGEVPLPCPPSFGLGTTRHRTYRLSGQSRSLRSTVIEYQALSVAV